MSEPQDYAVSMPEALWAGKPSTVALRTPEGQLVVFRRGLKGKGNKWIEEPQLEHTLSLSEERAQELRANGYDVTSLAKPEKAKKEKE